MKKFLIACVIILLCLFLADYLYYNAGVYIDIRDNAPTTFIKNEGKEILFDRGDGYEPFEIRGVDMGAGMPGYYATEYAIKKEDYLRWFKYIKEMGANTIRVYTILQDDFYNAFYEYNKNNPEPLYLIHGLWVNDYVQFSHMDAYDPKFINVILEDSKTLVDVIHGKKKLSLGRGLGSGSYRRDVSPWVIGYILGVEWEDVTVAYTDNLREERKSFTGEYMHTTEESTPFEAMLAHVGDNIISYETKRYDTQRLVAFSNWPTTDPLDYSEEVNKLFLKCAKVDVEHIKTTDRFISGTFASYHIYPYFPDYLYYEENATIPLDEKGRKNSYRAYLKMINDHHTIPVIISEFGVPSSRGAAQIDRNTNRNQGGMSEKQQGEALVDCYRDIVASGCAGSVVFTWQDEWFKRTWNTMHSIELIKTAYWSDYQTNEQYFGLLSFDPGNEKSVCYVDGDFSEWNERDVVLKNGGQSISAKYDEKFFYLYVSGEGIGEGSKIYIPLDITPKTGANACKNYGLTFQRPADFVIAIDGKDNSRGLVQERYDVLRAMFSHDIDGIDAYEFPPAPDTDLFNTINLILQNTFLTQGVKGEKKPAELAETGKLTYGNANPGSPDFNSLADFCFGSGGLEIKLPWQLLNFSNPSEMQIHDDYYENYGVESIKINEMYVGLGAKGNKGETIPFGRLPLKGWGKRVTYHERLKSSYYMMKELWGGQS